MLPQEQNLGRGASTVQGDSWTRWLHEIRTLELMRTMGHVPLAWDSTALEIGSGDGLQLDLLRKRFRCVFGIDPENIPKSRGSFAKSEAEALPFPNRSFDLVISSNVVEHLADRQRAMAEVRRVLRAGGYSAHIVPTRTWKLTSLALNPLGYPLRVAEKWLAHRRLRSAGSKADHVEDISLPDPGLLKVAQRWVLPPIHGTFSSHASEFRSFGRTEWTRTFALDGFKFIAEVPLLFYTQFGFFRSHFVPMRISLAHLGLASSRAFIYQMAAPPQ